MELIDFTQGLYKDMDLSDVTLITCHHILEIDYMVLEALCEYGLKPENIYVLGKPYSTSEQVLKKYKQLGAYVDDASMVIRPDMSFDNYFGGVIQDFIAIVNEKVSGKVIVWDDGGLLSAQLNGITDLPFDIIGAVEQTSSGFNKLANTVLNFPIVNMARSKAKLQFESPFIAEKNMECFREYVGGAQNDDIKSVLIIGGGPIGQVMKRALGDAGVQVSIYDMDICVSDYAKGVELSEIISDFDVVIGATGEQTLTVEQSKLLESHCILFSVSSSDREFDGVGWRREAGVTDTAVHNNIYLGNRVLLNNGFPLNFDGEPESVPLKYIQLTGALTLAAIYTAIQIGERLKGGWVDIPVEKQKAIVSEFKSYKCIDITS